MFTDNSKDTPSSVSDDSPDQFDKMMSGIMQSSIGMVFRQLIEPAEHKNIESPPPLKLHDFGGSDFVRLAEKSRRNRSKASKPYHDSEKPMAALSNGGNKVSPSPYTSTGSKSTMAPLVMENESTMKQTQEETTTSLSARNNDWKCTQECVFRTDGSEETVYQKFHDGQATETLHHVRYLDGTIKNIKKPMIPSSPSATSSLSSMTNDTTPTTSPFKRLWYLVFA